MTKVTITRDESVTQMTFPYASDARSRLLLMGFTFDENDRHSFYHPYTGATAKIEFNQEQTEVSDVL